MIRILLLTFLFSSFAAAKSLNFHCTAYDIVDVTFSGTISDESPDSSSDLNVAILDVPYVVSKDEVTYNMRPEVHEKALVVEVETPSYMIQVSWDGESDGTASMDFKGVILDEAPAYCSVHSSTRN